MAGGALDKSKPNYPLAGLASDGYSNENEATATCYCGAVQLAFPVQGKGFLGTFVCNCSDCHKITGSMFASNFTVDDEYLKHLRGQQKLSKFSQNHTIARKDQKTGKRFAMTNYFCSSCGSLMYRKPEAFPSYNFLRIGTVDDFSLMETKLRPQSELFLKSRVDWLKGVDGVKQCEALDEDTMEEHGGVGFQ